MRWTSLLQLMVVMARPEAKNLLTVSRQATDGSAHPSMQWYGVPSMMKSIVLRACRRFVTVPAGGRRLAIVPVLAFSWGSNVRLLRLDYQLEPNKKPIRFSAMGTYRSKNVVAAVHWLSDRTMVLFDMEVKYSSDLLNTISRFYF